VSLEGLISKGDRKSLGISGIDSVLLGSRLDAISSQSVSISIRVPVLGVKVDNCRSSNARVHGVFAAEERSLGVESHTSGLSLSSHLVRAGESLDLPALESSIVFVETFRSLTTGSRGCQIFVVFELPVSPTVQPFVSVVAGSLNFGSAVLLCEASSEFRKEEWDSESLGILISLVEALLSPGVAGSSMCRIGLSILLADSIDEYTAVVMVV
jgi:hypothetical protein